MINSGDSKMRDKVLNIIHRGVEAANRFRLAANQTPDPAAREALTAAAATLESGLRDCYTVAKIMEMEGHDYLSYQVPHYIPADAQRGWPTHPGIGDPKH